MRNERCEFTFSELTSLISRLEPFLRIQSHYIILERKQQF